MYVSTLRDTGHSGVFRTQPERQLTADAETWCIPTICDHETTMATNDQTNETETTTSTDRFQQSRKNWATHADPAADTVYADWFDIESDDIYDLESLVDDVHDTDGGYATHQILDYAGIDRVIDCNDRIITVAQRWRRPYRDQVDLSIRAENGVYGRCAELTKWQTAHETGVGFIPDVIAFGIWESTLEVFQTLHLINTRELIKAMEAGEIDYERHHKPSDGTAAVYIALDDVEDTDCHLYDAEAVTVDGPETADVDADASDASDSDTDAEADADVEAEASGSGGAVSE